jgi:hypothetical protein
MNDSRRAPRPITIDGVIYHQPTLRELDAALLRAKRRRFFADLEETHRAASADEPCPESDLLD